MFFVFIFTDWRIVEWATTFDTSNLYRENDVGDTESKRYGGKGKWGALMVVVDSWILLLAVWFTCTVLLNFRVDFKMLFYT